MEERGHHCMVLKKGDMPLVSYLSYKVFSEDDLDKAAEWFAAKNLPVEWVEHPIRVARCPSPTCSARR